MDQHRQILLRQGVQAPSEGVVVEIRGGDPLSEDHVARHSGVVTLHTYERELASDPHHRTHHTLGTHPRTEDPPGPVVSACRVYQLPDPCGFCEGHDDRAHGVQTLVGLLPVVYLQFGTDDAHTLTLQRQAGRLLLRATALVLRRHSHSSESSRSIEESEYNCTRIFLKIHKRNRTSAGHA